ncbi:peroxidase 5-like [Pyrus ussuriensis x Pyrus communis]|uniref:Peroxidase 5-like n=1 Tax=Pyrus ussuriensis x Pyrus communis TaxID=2448454 RepID=A0A5N5HEV8_9ROSA|nr:peroxidase 5-like [Pyrus ussuriensis x Pyrus communis]
MSFSTLQSLESSPLSWLKMLHVGDNCVSLGVDCYNADIKNITCGPSHGIRSFGATGDGVVLALNFNRSTAGIVRNNAVSGAAWAIKLGAAMVKMGSIDALTGRQGEIKKNCRVVN